MVELYIYSIATLLNDVEDVNKASLGKLMCHEQLGTMCVCVRS
jgi:hypothetical protein